jgi:glycosyltransferase involved in cell wall biosynthesis
MRVTVIIPALNEVSSIEGVLKEIPKDVVDEILVVDGHSTDGTRELVRKLGHKVVEQEGRGYGLAVSTGVKHATGDVIVLMDADGSYEPKDISRLLRCLADGYDIAFGSRYMPGSGSDDDTLVRYVGNKLFTLLLNTIYGVGISDSLFLYVAAKKEVFQSLDLKSPSFEYCMEFPIKAHRAGYKIAEVPSFERKRTAGDSKVNAFYNGLRILWVLLTELPNPLARLLNKRQPKEPKHDIDGVG